MLLKSIVINGFKSFADKIKIDFNSGITAVVGPNGSGKSNVADAVLWVLGEQSVRLLRGEKMEDVIFAGAQKRKKANMAEVYLVFDNSLRRTSFDLDEISVGRRIFRSGESEYFINKNQCRLKDAINLLSDIGISRGAMTVIGQNRMDFILNSKPEERRLIFEEIAGIGKYKQQKKETVRKLEETNLNLTRIEDILNELNEQLILVEEKAIRAEKFQELFRQKKDLHIKVILSQCQEINVKKEKIIQKKFNDEIKLKEIKEKIDLLIKEKDDFTKKTEEIEKKINEKLSVLQKISEDKADKSQTIVVLEEKILQNEKNLQRLTNEKKTLEQELDESLEKETALDKDIKLLNDKIAVMESALKQDKKDYEIAKEEIKKIEINLAEETENKFSFMHELVNLRNNTKHFTQQIDALVLKINQNEKEAEKTSSDKVSLEKQLDELLCKIQNAQQKAEELKIQKDSIKEKKEYYDCELLKIEGFLKKQEQVFQEKKARMHALQNLQNDYEGFSKATKMILKNKEKWAGNFCGTVADVLEVPKEYISAVEATLGNNLQNIIVENEYTAKSMIAFLRENAYGRTSFLPINIIKERALTALEEKMILSGQSLGLLVDKIDFAEKFKSVIKYLLGRIILATDLEMALKIAKENKYALRIVTLTGEIIQPGGVMVGGSLYRKEGGYLGRKAEIVLLENECTKLFNENREYAIRIQEIQKNLAESRLRLDELKELQLSTETFIVEEKAFSKNLKLQTENLINTLETLQMEKIQYQKEKRFLQEELNKSQQKIKEMAEEEIIKKSLAEKWQVNLQSWQEKKEGFTVKLEKGNVEYATIKQQKNGFLFNLKELKERVLKIKEKKKNLDLETEKIEDYQQRGTENLSKLKQSLEEFLSEFIKLDEKINELRSEKSEQLSKLKKIEKEIDVLQKESANDLSKCHRMEVELATLESNFQYQQNILEENYGLNFFKIQEDFSQELFDVALLKKELKEIEDNISLLGIVDTGSIDTYKQFKERKDFLLKQKNDLITSLNNVQIVLEEIEKKMSTVFIDAWDKISVFFTDIFEKLFDGGKAILKLTDLSNVLNSGIEIFAQPPGKKTQALNLLSGGERALTVIALLFSFLKFNPAPFCVLDELDAALDEVNVKRFSEFMQKYADSTQFIIITHRKLTMEAAKVLYGVTMQENGVSKVISVNLEKE